MEIVSLSKQTLSHLAHLFYEMWPEETTYKAELKNIPKISEDNNQKAFLAKDSDSYVGFIHVSIRHEYVDGMISASGTKFIQSYFVIFLDISSLLISHRAKAMLLLRALLYPKIFRNTPNELYS